MSEYWRALKKLLGDAAEKSQLDTAFQSFISNLVKLADVGEKAQEESKGDPK